MKNTNPQKTKSRSNTHLFLSAQVAALIGTAIDFAMFFLLTEIFGIWYVTAQVIGAGCGAITNFILGRYWVFTASDKKIHGQAFRYFLVAAGSMVLNTLGIYLLTEYSPLDAPLSKVIVAVLVAVTFNFFFQKNYVYK